MARVPYEPFSTAEPTTQGTSYEAIPTNPAAFGAGVAEATERLGAGIGQDSEAIAQSALRMQDLNNQADAQNALGHYVQQAGALDAQYRTLSGKAAADAYPAFLKSAGDLREQVAGTLKSPAAQVAFSQSARYLETHLTLGASQYAAAQQQQWWKQSKVSNIDTMTNLAVQNAANPALVTTAENSVAHSVASLGALNNWDDSTVTAQTTAAVGRFYQSVIAAKMGTPPDQGGGPQAALAMFNAVRGKLDAESIVKIQGMLHPVLKDQEGDAIVGQALTGTAGTAGTAGGGSLENNVGNIRATNAAWEGKGAPVNGFETFATPELGVKAAVTQLQDYAARNGGTITLGDAIKQWAPPSENNTAAYTATVSKQTGLGADAPLPLDDPMMMARVVKAMTGVEKGNVPFGDDVFIKGAAAAIGKQPLEAAAGGTSTAPGWQMPDWSKAEERVLQLTQGDDEARGIALTKLKQTQNRIEMATATERANLEKTQGDLTNAALAGLPIDVPTDRIRAVFPPDEADRRITDLGIAQGAGQVLAGIKWGSPQDVQRVLTDLTTGVGTVSDKLRAQLAGTKGLGTVTTPAGPEQPASVTETPEAFGMRTRIAALALQQIQARAKALMADAGGYVATEPTVSAAAKTMDPQKPDTFENFARTSLAVQDHLGVPAAAQHVLTMPQAQDEAAKLTAPGVDVKMQMEGLAKQWGAAWPHVFGDLVTLGKLPGAYQSVAVLDDPKDAALLARAINETSKGGRDWTDILGNAGGKPVASAIRDSVRNDPTIMQLERSLSNSGASAQQVDGIVSSVETLAFAKRFYNQDQNAGQDAVKAFTGKYVFLPNGDARVPSAIADTVTANAAATLHGLTLDKIAVPGVFRAPGEDIKARPTAPAAADYLLSVQSNPTWITSPRGDALWLMDNQARIVRGKDGKPVAVPFATAPVAAAAALAARVPYQPPTSFGFVQ